MILKRYIEAVPGFSTIGKMPTLLRKSACI